ncbi:hypothetical protein C8Q80DRAFT_1149484 [Daedaleopsis nitida]|nr:hypothetical protein C8Q80DRAFT_1149484 [Daedaleopsis nitida]
MADPGPTTASNDMDALLDVVQSMDDDDYGDHKIHASVYECLKYDVFPSSLPTSCPPLPLVVYAIRNIIQPSFLLQEIPSLLRLLVHLEIIRKRLLGTVDSLLCSPDLSAALLLNVDAADKLKRIGQPIVRDAQRTVYRQIIHACCLLHVRHVWRNFNPEIHPPLPQLLVDYFPAFAERETDLRQSCMDARKNLPWHHDTTQDELDANREQGTIAARFVYNAGRYGEDPESYCRDHGVDMNSSFDDLFPPPDTENVVKTIMRFIKMVITPQGILDRILEEAVG